MCAGGYKTNKSIRKLKKKTDQRWVKVHTMAKLLLDLQEAVKY